MRLHRASATGTLTHVISRFVDRDWLIRDDVERHVYLEMFGRAMRRTDWRCLAYALMSSHLHFAMMPGIAPLETWAKSVNSGFAQWLNARHGRLGPIFADRPAEHARRVNQPALIAYIHNNPPNGGVVRRAKDSTWTSHRAYLGEASAPPWLHVAEGLALCGFKPSDRGAFDVWVNARRGDTVETLDMRAVRAAAKAHALEVATPCLAEEAWEVPLFTPRGGHVRPAPSKVIEATTSVLGVERGAMCSRTNAPRLVEAKRVFVHAMRAVGNTASEAARQLGISPQAVSKHLAAPLSVQQQQAVETIIRRTSESRETCES